VIYSYECKVELGMDNRVLIWRRPGEELTRPLQIFFIPRFTTLKSEFPVSRG